MRLAVKGIPFFILLLSLSMLSWSQKTREPGRKDKKLRNKEIYSLFQNSQYYDCIEAIDEYHKIYPPWSYTWTMRGFAHLRMNEMYRVRQDFKMALSCGTFIPDYWIVNFYSNKDAMAKVVAGSYFDDFETELGDDYIPIVRPQDTLQGGLRAERNCFDVNFYDLTVRIDADKQSISGNNKIYFQVIDTCTRLQIDLFENYDIHTLNLDGKELAYSRLYNAIFIESGDKLYPGESHVLYIKYSGIPRIAPDPPWNGGFIWKKQKRKHWVGVACEHLGASSWWPNKDHLSDKPDSMRINVQVPKGYQAISNGNLISQYSVDDNYENFEWFVQYPINNYNVTFYMGDFVNFNETYSNGINEYPIDYYVLPKSLDDAKEYYKQTKEIVRVYEDIYGEYPFVKDGIGMVEAPYAGMEHQGAIAIGDDYGKEEHRDYNVGNYDYLVVHELAHEWWGNSVAIGDMADAWINEGFATYAEYLFIEKLYGYKEYLNACADNMGYITNLFPIAGKKNTNINTFYTGDIYNKGAAVLHNLRCIMNNDSLYMAMTKAIFQKFRSQIIETQDITNFINEYTGKDYNSFFQKYLYETDPAVLQYQFSIKDNQLRFKYMWMDVEKDFSMPFCICVNTDSCIRLTATSQVQMLILENVESFYIPTGSNYKADLIPHNSLTYFWTYRNEDGEMSAICNDHSGEIYKICSFYYGQLHGDYRIYRDDILLVSGTYMNGNRHGKWIFNYLDGEAESKGSYMQGERVGEWHYYNKMNQEAFRVNYSDDKPDYANAIYIVNNKVEPESADTLSWVDCPPQFKYSDADLYEFIYSGISSRIPEDLEIGSGITILSFYVMPDGKLTKIKVEKSFSEDLSKYLLEIFEDMPEWIPGYHRGKAVVVKMGMPVKYPPEKK